MIVQIVFRVTTNSPVACRYRRLAYLNENNAALSSFLPLRLREYPVSSPLPEKRKGCLFNMLLMGTIFSLSRCPAGRLHDCCGAGIPLPAPTSYAVPRRNENLRCSIGTGVTCSAVEDLRCKFLLRATDFLVIQPSRAQADKRCGCCGERATSNNYLQGTSLPIRLQGSLSVTIPEPSYHACLIAGLATCLGSIAARNGSKILTMGVP